jgi:hypothetical protein
LSYPFRLRQEVPVRNQQPGKPAAAGPVLIPVPWSEADALQYQLRKDGLGSTVHLDPARNHASLELWLPQEGQRD